MLYPIEAKEYTILQLDPSGIIQAQNRPDAGYESSEIIGQHVGLLFPAEDQKNDLPRQLLKVAQEKGSVAHTGWRVRKDRSQFRIKTVVTALRNATGTVSGFIEMSWDLTNVQESEREIHQTKARLVETLKERTTELERICDHLEEEVANRTQELQAFSYSVSHDLVAPLRAITGYSAILLEDYKEGLNEEGQQVLSIITRNVDRMNQLIREVLKFSRLNRQPISHQTIDMNAVFSESYGRLRASEDAGRTIDFQMDNLPAGYGDREMISQVVNNLISNALKYTRSREKTVIRAKGYASEEESTYSVQDNGVGFDERYKDKLFDIFQRLHKETEFEGAGMGLAMAQQILRKHNGKIWGKGKPNQGATFCFTLPLPPVKR